MRQGALAASQRRRRRGSAIAAELLALSLLFSAGVGCTTGGAANDDERRPRPGAAPPADLVLRGAAVYTVDAARSLARAVAVRDGRIVYVGSEAGAEKWIGPATDVLDLPGRMVLPGFQDAHAHPVTSGVEIGQCDLLGLGDRDAVLAEVAECGAAQEGEWLVGAGWQLPIFPGAEPAKELLDEIAPGRPAYLVAADGHSAWVSSRALELAGIDAATPDPRGGRIERRPGGEPSGTLRETAMALVGRLVPPPGLEERVEGLLRAQELFLRHGVTAVQEASASLPELEAYQAAAERGLLDLRIVAALDVDLDRGSEDPATHAAELADLARRFTGPRLSPTAAKIFLDGVIEARTAAMLEPYLDRPGTRGELNLPPERLDPLVAALAAEGFDVHVHAIGDRAVRVALDAFERVNRYGSDDDASSASGRGSGGAETADDDSGAGSSARPSRRPRHQLAHVQVIDPSDVPRFRRLGVIANFQPLWAFPDTYIRDLTWPALGPERSRWIYPMASVHRAGGAIAFGSDWSVSSLNPLEGIEVAVTRRDPDDPAGAVMQPEQRLDLPTALAAYTAGAARANRLEAETGSIEPGKAADLVVLSHDLFEITPAEISEVEVLLALIEGEAVYRAAGDP